MKLIHDGNAIFSTYALVSSGNVTESENAIFSSFINQFSLLSLLLLLVIYPSIEILHYINLITPIIFFTKPFPKVRNINDIALKTILIETL